VIEAMGRCREACNYGGERRRLVWCPWPLRLLERPLSWCDALFVHTVCAVPGAGAPVGVDRELVCDCSCWL
jgi:hypothetical protein